MFWRMERQIQPQDRGFRTAFLFFPPKSTRFRSDNICNEYYDYSHNWISQVYRSGHPNGATESTTWSPNHTLEHYNSLHVGFALRLDASQPDAKFLLVVSFFQVLTICMTICNISHLVRNLNCRTKPTPWRTTRQNKLWTKTSTLSGRDSKKMHRWFSCQKPPRWGRLLAFLGLGPGRTYECRSFDRRSRHPTC